MTGADTRLEDKVREALRLVDPAPALRPGLTDSIMASLPPRRVRHAGRTRSAGLLAAAIGVALVATAAVWFGAASTPTGTATPSPSAGAASPSPSGNGFAPYVITELAGVDTPAQPPRTIAAPTDCAFLADDWLRSLCRLTLIADWQKIPVAPFTQNEGPDPGLWAAVSRAQLDGDPAFCLHGLARTYYSLSHIGGSAPPPNATAPPIHPVAECISGLRSMAAAGAFVMEDRGPPVKNGTVLTSGPSVTFTVSAGAATRAAQGVAPAFDPAAGCFAVSWALCDEVLDLATATLGDHQATISELDVVGPMVVGCPGLASDAPTPAPCPPPSGGTWVGGVVAGSRGAPFQVVVAFDIAEVGGQITLVEVPFHR